LVGGPRRGRLRVRRRLPIRQPGGSLPSSAVTQVRSRSGDVHDRTIELAGSGISPSVFPVPRFPDILEGCGARRLVWMTAWSTSRPPASLRPDGSWSILEKSPPVAGRGAVGGRLDDFFAGAETLRPAGYDATRLETARFNRAAVEESWPRSGRLASATWAAGGSRPSDVGRTAFHPRLSAPSRARHDGLRAEHDDHHLARITQLSGSRERKRCHRSEPTVTCVSQERVAAGTNMGARFPSASQSM